VHDDDSRQTVSLYLHQDSQGFPLLSRPVARAPLHWGATWRPQLEKTSGHIVIGKKEAPTASWRLFPSASFPRINRSPPISTGEPLFLFLWHQKSWPRFSLATLSRGFLPDEDLALSRVSCSGHRQTIGMSIGGQQADDEQTGTSLVDKHRE